MCVFVAKDLANRRTAIVPSIFQNILGIEFSKETMVQEIQSYIYKVLYPYIKVTGCLCVCLYIY